MENKLLKKEVPRSLLLSIDLLCCAAVIFGKVEEGGATQLAFVDRFIMLRCSYFW
jgi:hypothetical protein